MKRFAFIFVFAAVGIAAAISVAGQCPEVKVYGPSSDYKVGEPVMFSVNVTGGDTKVTPQFRWVISDGKIVKGEKDAVLNVDSTGIVNDTITATVEVTGFAASCNTTMSSTAYFTRAPVAKKVDEFGVLKPKDEAARLDNFTIELQNDPMANAHVIVYAGKKSKAGDTQAALARIRKYLADTRGVSEDRIVLIDGGSRIDPAIELWVTPYGGSAPTPTPAKP